MLAYKLMPAELSVQSSVGKAAQLLSKEEPHEVTWCENEPWEHGKLPERGAGGKGEAMRC